MEPANPREPDERALERLGPFELKDRLVELAAGHARSSARTLLNAGRGNPNWLALAPREAFVLLSDFALQESRREAFAEANGSVQLGGLPAATGIARRLRAYLAARADEPGAALLARALRYAGRELHFEADAFVHELADGAAGGRYPEPPRMLRHAEAIVRACLLRILCAGEGRGGRRQGARRPGARLDLFAVEGATAGICYLFDTLLVNGLLRRRDRIAVVVPIFSPYLEILDLERYAFRVVRIEASERRADGSHAWQVPDAEIDKLADPSIRALVMVNPSNPPSVAMRARTLERLARLVRARRPDLIVVSDDVYATYVPGFRSVLARLPRNTVCLYSFSKYFGCTGWRLGVVALREDNVLDRALAQRPAPRRYAALTLDPRKLKFIDRMVADSRAVALNHTAGLSAPQQVMMTLMALSELLDRAGSYPRLARSVIARRLRALYRGLGVDLPEDPLRAGYYCELDLMVWAQTHYGPGFVRFLKRQRRPIGLLLRLARRASIVLMPCAGFGGPEWSVRVSLANLPEQAYARIGAELHAAARDYVLQWHAGSGTGRSAAAARPGAGRRAARLR